MQPSTSRPRERNVLETLNHYALPEFWGHYRVLAAEVQSLADKSFVLLRTDSRHPSLRLKKVGDYFSVRIGLSSRALGVKVEHGVSWFWIALTPSTTSLLANAVFNTDPNRRACSRSGGVPRPLPNRPA